MSVIAPSIRRQALTNCKVFHHQYSTTDLSRARKAVLRIPKSNVYRFGDSNDASPVFRDVQWTVNEGESWAVIGSGSGDKTALFQMLLGNLRISPPPPPPAGLFPFLSRPSSGASRDPHECISMVSFGNRRRSSGGAFYDYTARYGAVREEDRVTLRQSMFPESQSLANIAFANAHEKNADADICPPEGKESPFFDELIEKMGLTSLLDIPLVALSNGQTRRARIVKAVLSKPELLLLDEPLTGLDVQNRPTLLSVLHSLHTARSPRVIMGLRIQDPIPDWITHVAVVRAGRVITGSKDKVLAEVLEHKQRSAVTEKQLGGVLQARAGKVLVDVKNLGVKYSKRTVLKNITWEIREGERWHLQGTNGSGKTTLLSLLTGDHPQSYTQLPPASHLNLFGRPRSRIPTPHLHSLIGVVSPELFDAFPRRAGMSVWEAVGTGFDGGFVPLGQERVGLGVMRELNEEERQWRVGRCWEVLEALGPGAWVEAHEGTPAVGCQVGSSGTMSTEVFKNRAFVELSVAEQRMVLLMRALVGRPPLVLLDEVWSGMDEGMVRAARKYLRAGGVGEEQAVVVITHWEEEVPWGTKDGVKRFMLQAGEGRVVTGS